MKSLWSNRWCCNNAGLHSDLVVVSSVFHVSGFLKSVISVCVSAILRLCHCLSGSNTLPLSGSPAVERLHLDSNNSLRSYKAFRRLCVCPFSIDNTYLKNCMWKYKYLNQPDLNTMHMLSLTVFRGSDPNISSSYFFTLFDEWWISTWQAAKVRLHCSEADGEQ